MNITELCEFIKNQLPKNNLQVTGEVSQSKLSQGHLYLTLKDNTSSIKAIIWKSKYNLLKKNILDGDKLTINCKIDYYNYSGSINLIINEIIENTGIGDIQKDYELLKNEYLSKGYFNKIHKLEMPKIIKRIVILTSASCAAIQDFIFNLNNNNSKIEYEIIDVQMQGIESPQLIANKLNEINTTNIDLIVITRGGGSLQDLYGFSNKILIDAVFNYKLKPILSAIGHQTDNPLLDLVADYSCPTPSLAAQYLVDVNEKYINNLISIKDDFKNIITTYLYNKKNKLLQLDNKLKIMLNNISDNFKQNIKDELNTKKIKLLNLLDILNNPYIVLFDLNYNKILNEKEIKTNDILFLRWNNCDLKIKIL